MSHLTTLHDGTITYSFSKELLAYLETCIALFANHTPFDSHFLFHAPRPLFQSMCVLLHVLLAASAAHPCACNLRLAASPAPSACALPPAPRLQRAPCRRQAPSTTCAVPVAPSPSDLCKLKIKSTQRARLPPPSQSCAQPCASA